MARKDNNKWKEEDRQVEKHDDFGSQFSDFEDTDQSSSRKLGDISDENQEKYEESHNADGSFVIKSKDNVDQANNDEDNLKVNFEDSIGFYNQWRTQFCTWQSFRSVAELSAIGIISSVVAGLTFPTPFDFLKRLKLGLNIFPMAVGAVFVECSARSLRRKDDAFNSVLGFGLAGMAGSLVLIKRVPGFRRFPFMIVKNTLIMGMYGYLNHERRYYDVQKN